MKIQDTLFISSKFPCASLQSTLPPPSGNCRCAVSVDQLQFLELHVNGIIQYVLYYVQFLSLFLRFTPIMCIKLIHFYCCAALHRINIPHNPFTPERHQGCFQFVIIMKQEKSLFPFLLGKYLGVGSFGHMEAFLFIRNCHTVSQNGCIISHFHQ